MCADNEALSIQLCATQEIVLVLILWIVIIHNNGRVQNGRLSPPISCNSTRSPIQCEHPNWNYTPFSPSVATFHILKYFRNNSNGNTLCQLRQNAKVFAIKWQWHNRITNWLTFDNGAAHSKLNLAKKRTTGTTRSQLNENNSIKYLRYSCHEYTKGPTHWLNGVQRMPRLIQFLPYENTRFSLTSLLLPYFRWMEINSIFGVYPSPAIRTKSMIGNSENETND